MNNNPSTSITAIVVCHNAADHLDDCLRSLRWVDELLIVNMQSTDNTLEIASRWADRIFSDHRYASLEEAYAVISKQARHDWVLLAQPNDRIPQSLAHELQTVLPFRKTTCALRIPRQFYFRNKPLAQIPCGHQQHEHLLIIAPQHCHLKPQQQDWIVPHQNFTIDDLPQSATMPVRYQWLNAYRQMPVQWFEQIPIQGMRLYQKGQHIGLRDLTGKPMMQILRAFKHMTDPKHILHKTSHAMFDTLAAGVCGMHQLRKTPKSVTDTLAQSLQKAA